MKIVFYLVLSLLIVGCQSTGNRTATSPVSQEKVDAFLTENIRIAKALIPDNVGTVQRKGDQVIITLKGDRSFTHDSADIRYEAQDVLKQLSTLINRLPESRVFIAGHTDSIGSEEYNRILSTKRAQSVSDLLVDNGVDEDRLGIFGFGENSPIADNQLNSGRQANRRIEVRVTPKFDMFAD
ncbi:OmpA family protein [Photobacterium minamisatsumaniensis]|uniref:OmpA family protein n=1 Tax=Photobacterium minamisatsumaniensis TaxID=2910233 RepID=UPI003D1358C9